MVKNLINQKIEEIQIFEKEDKVRKTMENIIIDYEGSN